MPFNHADPLNAYPAKQWGFKNYLYAKLKRDLNLLSSQPSFIAFIQNEASTYLGQFFEVKKMLNEAIGSSSTGIDFQKLQLASNLNNNINAVALFEQNQKTVNQILLTSFLNQGGELSALQVAALEQIAVQCSENGGPAVGQAASAIFNKICNPINTSPFGSCGEASIPPISLKENEERSTHSKVNGLVGQLNAFEFEGILTIVLPTEQSGSFSLFDMKGNEIYTQKIHGNEEALQIDVSKFQTGIYFASFNGKYRCSAKIFLSH